MLIIRILHIFVGFITFFHEANCIPRYAKNIEKCLKSIKDIMPQKYDH